MACDRSTIKLGSAAVACSQVSPAGRRTAATSAARLPVLKLGGGAIA
jgi:hypothetical protein